MSLASSNLTFSRNSAWRSQSRRSWLAATIMVALAACGSGDSGVVRLPADQSAASPSGDQPPVAVNPETPIEYPEALFEQGIEGSVLLRLFVDSSGALLMDSASVHESSGYPALDSAAMAGAESLRFSPAMRDGRAVATYFLQPVEFRFPAGTEQ